MPAASSAASSFGPFLPANPSRPPNDATVGQTAGMIDSSAGMAP